MFSCSFTTKTNGISDLKLGGLYRFFLQDNRKAHFGLSLSLPTGSIDEQDNDDNSTLAGGINIIDAGDHVKSAAAVLWMQENFPGESFTVQAHVERQGAFIEDDDEGYNVEHMRDWNTLAPDVAFGFESQPGHQAQ